MKARLFGLFLLASCMVLIVAPSTLKAEDAEKDLKKAQKLYNANKYGEAIKECRKALKLKPDLVPAHDLLARALMTTGDRQGEEAEYRELIRLEPENAEAHSRLAGFLLNEKMVDASIAEYREAIRLKPDEPWFHLNLGNSLVDKGDAGTAVEEYRIAKQLNPESPGFGALCDGLTRDTEKGSVKWLGAMPYTVGGDVSPPTAVYKPDPPYSEEARKARYKGVLLLIVVIGADGQVQDVRVVKPLGHGLDESAIKTVRTWQFKPALRDGIPVPVRVLVEVAFKLWWQR